MLWTEPNGVGLLNTCMECWGWFTSPWLEPICMVCEKRSRMAAWADRQSINLFC